MPIPAGFIDFIVFVTVFLMIKSPEKSKRYNRFKTSFSIF